MVTKFTDSNHTTAIKTLTISVCTYKRPNLLRNAIRAVKEVIIPVGLNVDLLIVDNASSEEVKAVVQKETSDLKIPARYVAEHQRGIVHARNRVLSEANANGVDYLAMFDDDDCPDAEWLINLWNCLNQYSATVVTGRMVFTWPDEMNSIDEEVKKVFDDPFSNDKTGDIKERCGSGNTLVDFSFIREHNLTFNPFFNLTGGEDSHFFESISLMGGKIVRCNEAIVYSEIVEERANEEFIWGRRYNVGYVTYFKDKLLFGKSKALRIAFKMIASNSYKNLIHYFSKSKRVQIKRKRKMIEIKGLLDAIIGVKYENYAETDGS